MASENRLWGAERIRGELLKLGVKASKRTVQKYMFKSRYNRSDQTWVTFLKNHIRDIAKTTRKSYKTRWTSEASTGLSGPP
jgi:hypothetical protein